MSTFLPGPPEPNEYNPAFAAYVAKANAAGDPLRKLSEQMEELLRLFASMDASKRTYRYSEGKWSVQELLHHMIDTERVFAYRALRVARNDQTPLPGFDENLFAAHADSERWNWEELLDEFTYVRKSSVLLLRHLTPEAWTRVGVSNGSPLSTRAMAHVMIGHVAHHLAILRERYL